MQGIYKRARALAGQAPRWVGSRLEGGMTGLGWLGPGCLPKNSIRKPQPTQPTYLTLGRTSSSKLSPISTIAAISSYTRHDLSFSASRSRARHSSWNNPRCQEANPAEFPCRRNHGV